MRFRKLIPKGILKKIALGIVLIIIVFAAIRATAPEKRNDLTQVEMLLRDFMAPLGSGVMQVSRTISNIGNSIIQYNELVEENRLLKEQIRELSLSYNQMEEYRLENQRYKALLSFKNFQKDSWELLGARVIGRSLNNLDQRIILDKGLKEGIKKDMSVINHRGLVGRVVAVSNNTAEVTLLHDRNSAVGAMVQKSRALGVVEAAPPGDCLLQMIHLPHDAVIEEGDILITSGLGQIFPKGLRIGYVDEVNMAPTGLVKTANVIPYVDFGRLEEVLVVINAIEEPIREAVD